MRVVILINNPEQLSAWLTMLSAKSRESANWVKQLNDKGESPSNITAALVYDLYYLSYITDVVVNYTERTNKNDEAISEDNS